jgi:SpoVK/Ycf46/Vps4 family AAA+-type ATPase
MKVDPNVNWGELARSTDEFGGAMLKAVCVEAGMIALRMGKNKIGHEHYVDAITEVQAKKKDVSFASILLVRRNADLFPRRSTSTHSFLALGIKAGIETVIIDKLASSVRLSGTGLILRSCCVATSRQSLL